MAPETTEPELDMAEAEEVYQNMPSREHNMERVEYMKSLDTRTLWGIHERGCEEGDMFNLMDAAAAGAVLGERGEV